MFQFPIWHVHSIEEGKKREREREREMIDFRAAVSL
jgi:hypothetical protein